MRSLTIKLILAFLIVSLTGAGVSSFFIQQRTRAEFERFLSSQYQTNLIDTLTRYYSLNGGWDGIEQVMQQIESLRRVPQLNPPPNNGAIPPAEIRRLPFVLVDANRVVIYEGEQQSSRRIASDKEIEQGVPLVVDGVTVGWLTLNARLISRFNGLPERTFLQSINRVILISALVAMAVAFLLGAALAENLSRPIRELTEATQALARGQLGTQVKIHSKDELGQLAYSFNQMSKDLARANQARRQMTADIAHDLRSPLSVILGYTEALSDGKLSGTPDVYDVMHKEAGHLNHLIDDLRTLSLADAGELPLFPQEIKPSVLLERAASAFRPLCEQKEITLLIEASPDMPEVKVDPERMAQVLGNLISNALRYTPNGGTILLQGKATPKAVQLHVWDNGPGIAPEDRAFIFHRFFRSDKSRSHNGETGLGLAIAKSLVEAHGGNIQLAEKDETGPGGAHFIIELPLMNSRA